MTTVDLKQYNAVFEPPYEFFEAVYRLADKVNGTVGITAKGRLVITLPRRDAVTVAANLTNEDFPYCYVVPETFSVLGFDTNGNYEVRN